MCCVTRQIVCDYADEDLYVYKVFHVYEHPNGKIVLTSPFYCTDSFSIGQEDIDCGWFENDLFFNTRNIGLIKGTYRVEYGFHSFESLQKAKELCSLFNKPNAEVYKVFKCRIKKGTKMYYGSGFMGAIGSYKCYTSEKIDILESVD